MFSSWSLQLKSSFRSRSKAYNTNKKLKKRMFYHVDPVNVDVHTGMPLVGFLTGHLSSLIESCIFVFRGSAEVSSALVSSIASNMVDTVR